MGDRGGVCLLLPVTPSPPSYSQSRGSSSAPTPPAAGWGAQRSPEPPKLLRKELGSSRVNQNQLELKPGAGQDVARRPQDAAVRQGRADPRWPSMVFPQRLELWQGGRSPTSPRPSPLENPAAWPSSVPARGREPTLHFCLLTQSFSSVQPGQGEGKGETGFTSPHQWGEKTSTSPRWCRWGGGTSTSQSRTLPNPACSSPGDFPHATPQPCPAPQRGAKAPENLIPEKNAAQQVAHKRLLNWRSPPRPGLPPKTGSLLCHEPRAPCDTHPTLLPQPTETERCIESLIAVFQRYAGRDGKNSTLSKREFLAFMNTELAAFTKVSSRTSNAGSSLGRSLPEGP